MALFPKVDFNKLAVGVIEDYVIKNEPHLTFEQRVARRAMQRWRERV